MISEFLFPDKFKKMISQKACFKLAFKMFHSKLRTTVGWTWSRRAIKT